MPPCGDWTSSPEPCVSRVGDKLGRSTRPKRGKGEWGQGWRLVIQGRASGRGKWELGYSRGVLRAYFHVPWRDGSIKFRSAGYLNFDFLRLALCCRVGPSKAPAHQYQPARVCAASVRACRGLLSFVRQAVSARF